MNHNHREIAAFAAFLKAPETRDLCFACHVSPDGDTLGSAAALALLCRRLHKRAFVYCPEPVPDTYAFLVPFFGEAFEPRSTVCVDVSTTDRLGNCPYTDRIAYVIDHHCQNSIPCAHKLVEADCAATGELVAAAMDCLDEPFDEDIALCLYTALASDTGCFRHANTTPESFALAARLSAVPKERNFSKINRILFCEKPRSLLLLESYALAHAHTDASLGYVFFAITDRIKRKFGMTAENADFSSVIDILRQFKGYTLFAVARQVGARRFKVSVRSEEDVDANALCKSFGGGGHLRAAGYNMDASPHEIEQRLRAYLRAQA